MTNKPETTLPIDGGDLSPDNGFDPQQLGVIFSYLDTSKHVPEWMKPVLQSVFNYMTLPAPPVIEKEKCDE